MKWGDALEDDVFVKVYNAFFPYVYRYVYGLTNNHQTAEDLAQEAFVKALSTPLFPNETIKSWLLTVAHNLYVDYVRKNRRLEFRENSLLSEIGVQDFTSSLILNETMASALECIQKLPENQCQAVLLCLVNDLSYEEAAEVLGISVSAVTNLIYRARKTLRALRRYGHE